MARFLESACWAGFGLIFRFSDLFGLAMDFAPPTRGSITDVQATLLIVRVAVLGRIRGDISRHFWSAWWPDFGHAFRESTVSTAFARKPCLTVYRAHSGVVAEVVLA